MFGLSLKVLNELFANKLGALIVSYDGFKIVYKPSRHLDRNQSLHAHTLGSVRIKRLRKRYTANFDEQICFVNDFSTSNRVRSFSSLQEIHSAKTLVRIKRVKEKKKSGRKTTTGHQIIYKV